VSKANDDQTDLSVNKFETLSKERFTSDNIPLKRIQDQVPPGVIQCVDMTTMVEIDFLYAEVSNFQLKSLTSEVYQNGREGVERPVFF